MNDSSSVAWHSSINPSVISEALAFCLCSANSLPSSRFLGDCIRVSSRIFSYFTAFFSSQALQELLHRSIFMLGKMVLWWCAVQHAVWCPIKASCWSLYTADKMSRVSLFLLYNLKLRLGKHMVSDRLMLKCWTLHIVKNADLTECVVFPLDFVWPISWSKMY